VTISGVGGVGKTRLALRVLKSVEAANNGAFLVELASLRDPELLAHTALSALGIPETSARSPESLLIEFFRERDALLVLDNCEHLLDACARLAEDILVACPAMRILATSIQSLGVPGEHVLPLSPLPLPVPGAELTEGSEVIYGALVLFADRARAVLPGFAIHDDNRDQIARLCAKLDGIPLAIELAAVRLKVLTVAELMDRIDRRFDVLTRGGRTAPARHQTLRATIDWTYELCDPHEQHLWARCSVFAGGFGLAAAEAVCSADDLPKDSILDSLSGLVEKTIFGREETAHGLRFSMLETIREYGDAKLAESGRTLAVRERHRGWCTEMLSQATSEWFGPDQQEWSNRLRLDYANLRKAFDFCLTAPGHERDGQYVIGRHWFLWASMNLSEGRYWLERALAATDEPSSERAEALATFGYIATLQGDVDAAAAALRECRELLRTLDDRRLWAYATHIAGLTELLADPAQATELLSQAVRRYEEASAEHELAVAARIQLGLAQIFIGERHRARANFEACRELCGSVGETQAYSYSLYGLGFVDMLDGNLASAATAVRESIKLKRAVQDTVGLSLALDLLGWTLVHAGEHRDAAVLLGAAYRLWDSFGHQLFNSPHWLAHGASAQADARAAIGDRAFDAAFARGRHMTLEQVLAFALQECPADEAAASDPLTAREREVAKLIALGKSNREIAGQLRISQRTVDAHVEHIFAKLGFGTRAQVAAWVAERRG
jgi:predicted ATPase/DNA-binding CsgD family transcriptional regulator